MSNPQTCIQIPVDLSNPGQFFACCGLLELADRLSPETLGWFDNEVFCLNSKDGLSFNQLLSSIKQLIVANTMSVAQLSRLAELSVRPKKELTAEQDVEKKALESQRREESIMLAGPIPFRIDWFRDGVAGGSRFKTWAGQQSVIEIAKAMHEGIELAGVDQEETLFKSARGIGLPFNFDSDLGGQGSALDIGFSFDPLAGSEATRIAGACRPALEFLCFLGLQRFRPREMRGQNRFVYGVWTSPLPSIVASAVVAQAISVSNRLIFEFRLLYRTKYLKSFLPASPFQGDANDRN
jgi:CRISPR-associated protein Csb3